MAIPVAPAAHYHMGGVATDLWGKTSAPGLSAIGECASTGAHGANRLASNSLLEAMVFAFRVATRLRDERAVAPSDTHATLTPALPHEVLQELRAVMSAEVGVVRDAAGLRRAGDTIDGWIEAHGAASALIAARLVAQAALAREESRGGHYRADFPETATTPQRTFIQNRPKGPHDAA
jgi:L-aspartate oxidase